MQDMCDIKVSVIITTYNRKYEVARALKSVLDQTVSPFEVIIVDDGSVDGTKEYLESRGRERYRYIYNSVNKGPGRSRNIGMIASQGEYIAYLDSDNEWYPNKLEKFLDVIRNNSNIDIICSKYKKHIEFSAYEYPGEVADTDISIEKEVFLHNFADASATLYKKSCLVALDGFNENMLTNIDWELMLRAFTLLSPKVYKLQDVLSENWAMDDGLSANKCKELEERMNMLSLYWSKIADKQLRKLFYRQYAIDHKEWKSEKSIKANFYKWVGYDESWIECEIEAFYSEIDNLRNELEYREHIIHKKTNFYTLLFKWLESKQKGITIGTVLEKEAIKSVAIYGIGKHGSLALKELENSSVSVEYIIDKNTKKHGSNGIKVFDLSNSHFPQVDAIIITPYLELDQIVKSISGKVSSKIMSLAELVDKANQMSKEM